MSISDNITLTDSKKFRIIIKLYPGVAQLVARMVRVHEAVGSTPATRTRRSVLIGSEYPVMDAPHFFISTLILQPLPGRSSMLTSLKLLSRRSRRFFLFCQVFFVSFSNYLQTQTRLPCVQSGLLLILMRLGLCRAFFHGFLVPQTVSARRMASSSTADRFDTGAVCCFLTVRFAWCFSSVQQRNASSAAAPIRQTVRETAL